MLIISATIWPTVHVWPTFMPDVFWSSRPWLTAFWDMVTGAVTGSRSSPVSAVVIFTTDAVRSGVWMLLPSRTRPVSASTRSTRPAAVWWEGAAAQ